MYTHKETGTQGTREDWIAAYDPEGFVGAALFASRPTAWTRARPLFDSSITTD